MSLVFFVVGTPAPQGSKRAFVVKGKARMIEDNKRTRPWRALVTDAAMLARGDRPTLLGPLRVVVECYMPRPKGHWTKRGALCAKAPCRPAVKPDADKLARLVLDALTDAGVWRDDAQVVELVASKHYVGGDKLHQFGRLAGAVVTVEEVTAGVQASSVPFVVTSGLRLVDGQTVQIDLPTEIAP